MKWVVPTVTLAMRDLTMEPDSMTARMAAVMPEVASGVVGVFFRLRMPRFGSPWAARATSMATASVFVPGLVSYVGSRLCESESEVRSDNVPPTSTPMRMVLSVIVMMGVCWSESSRERHRSSIGGLPPF
jgi:hypothetical protein